MSFYVMQQGPEQGPSTHPVKGNAIFLQDGGRYQRHLVAKEGVTALGAAGEEACRG